VKHLERDESRLSGSSEELRNCSPPRRKGSATTRSRARREPPAPSPGSARGCRCRIKGELANRFGPNAQVAVPRGKVCSSVSRRARGSGRSLRDGWLFADWLRGFGNLLIIDHGKELPHHLRNNESVLKQVGDTEWAPGRVATRRSERAQHESGLYFEMSTREKHFDPMRWCP